jgi:hypothetical protein
MPNYSGYSYDELIHKRDEITFLTENMTRFDTLQTRMNRLEQEVTDKSCVIQELLEAGINGGKIKKPELHKAAMAKVTKLALIDMGFVIAGAAIYFAAGLPALLWFLILLFLVNVGIVLMTVHKEITGQESHYKALKSMNYKQAEKEKAALNEEYTRVKKEYDDMVLIFENIPGFMKETYHRYTLAKGGRLSSHNNNRHRYYLELGEYLCKYYPQCGLEASQWNKLIKKEIKAISASGIAEEKEKTNSNKEYSPLK